MLDKGTAWDRLAEAAEAYVLKSFGITMDLHPVASPGSPQFPLDRYRLWKGMLFGQPAVLMALKEWRQGAIGDMIKRRDLIRNALDARVVVVLLDRAPATLRKRLIERQVAFLAPGAQIYIPEALLDLRERSRTVPAPPPEKISPTAQTVLLAALLGRPVEGANLTELADRFRIAIMSMSRALDELEALRVAESRHAGRQRRLHLVLTQGALWRAIESRLQSPVRKVRLIGGDLPPDIGPLAGASALPHYVRLSAPRIERRAVPAMAWKQIADEQHLVTTSIYDPERIDVETWSYDPRVLAEGPVVDPISLYLSLRHDPDARVAQAAGQLLEPFAW